MPTASEYSSSGGGNKAVGDFSEQSLEEPGLSDQALELIGLASLRERSASGGGTSRSCCDPIFTHPRTGASIYCGGWSAANNLKALGSRNIRRVVNCQDRSSDNFFEKQKVVQTPDGWAKLANVEEKTDVAPEKPRSKESGPPTDEDPFEILYHRFHINGLDSSASTYVFPSRFAAKEDPSARKNREREVVQEFELFWRFLDDGLERGESGLIHCAAGMHRAGGASVSYLMWKHNLNYDKALKLAKSKRSVINPYHRNSLKLVEKALGV